MSKMIAKKLNRVIKKTALEMKSFGLKDWFLFTFVYPVIDTYHMLSERIGRTYAFARIAWLHYDFDSAYLWDIMAFKLKRIEKCLINGIAVQEPEEMAPLREAIEICERLFKEQYEDKYYLAHETKWGEQPCWLEGGEPLFVDGVKMGTKVVMKDRANVKTLEDKEQERKDFWAMFENANKDKMADFDRLNEIFKKHSASWWE